jgi:molecular chaperone Hsp33
VESDDWQRVKLFLETLEPVELLDTELTPENLLWRLFHEDEIRVLPAQQVHFQCTCNAEKVRPVLRSYPKAELTTLADKDEIIRTRCEFCGTTYEFPLSEFV